MLTHADVHWIELDSVDSTNDFLNRAYLQGQVSGHVAVLAKEQSAGRGRAGRVWQAKPGSSLCLTLGVPVAGYQMPFLPLCVGVAVARVLDGLGLSIRLKWPNDLLVGQDKLGGVLCESFQARQGAVTLIGLGLNLLPVEVNTPAFALKPTSLANHIPVERLPDLPALARCCVQEILMQIEAARIRGVDAIFEEFSRRDAWLGQPVQVQDQGRVCMSGTAMGIDSTGAYLLNTASGLCPVTSGDLSLRLMQ